MLVTLPLIPRGAGWREQDDGRAFCLALRAHMRSIERRLQITATAEGQLALELAGKEIHRLADQEGMTDAVEPGRERRHAALFGLAASDPVRSEERRVGKEGRS